jgi:hypothetical protein
MKPWFQSFCISCFHPYPPEYPNANENPEAAGKDRDNLEVEKLLRM